MSIPNIPDITPDIDLCREDIINLILASVALEEISLAHILNAEGEKIQHVLSLDKCKCTHLSDIKEINESATDMINGITRLQMLLQMKVENVLKLVPKNDCDHKDKCHEDECDCCESHECHCCEPCECDCCDTCECGCYEPQECHCCDPCECHCCKHYESNCCKPHKCDEIHEKRCHKKFCKGMNDCIRKESVLYSKWKNCI